MEKCKHQVLYTFPSQAILQTGYFKLLLKKKKKEWKIKTVFITELCIYTFAVTPRWSIVQDTLNISHTVNSNVHSLIIKSSFGGKMAFEA